MYLWRKTAICAVPLPRKKLKDVERQHLDTSRTKSLSLVPRRASFLLRAQVPCHHNFSTRSSTKTHQANTESDSECQRCTTNLLIFVSSLRVGWSVRFMAGLLARVSFPRPEPAPAFVVGHQPS
eukprot:s242_g21.t1